MPNLPPHATDAKVGETVHLVGKDIRIFAAICQKVVDQLDSWLAGSTLSSSADPQPIVEDLPAIAPNGAAGLMALDLDLSPFAREIAAWTAAEDKDARRQFVDRTKLRAAFVDRSENEIAEAVAELVLDNFVSTSAAYGDKIPSFRPTIELYATFDPLVGGGDPVDDSVKLSELILAGPDSVDPSKMIEDLNWSIRRFNPALELAMSNVADGRVLRTLGSKFVAASLQLIPEDRVALRRYVSRYTA